MNSFNILLENGWGVPKEAAFTKVFSAKASEINCPVGGESLVRLETTCEIIKPDSSYGTVW